MTRIDFVMYQDGGIFVSQHLSLEEDRAEMDNDGDNPESATKHFFIEFSNGHAEDMLHIVTTLHYGELRRGSGSGKGSSGVEEFLTAFFRAASGDSV